MFSVLRPQTAKSTSCKFNERMTTRRTAQFSPKYAPFWHVNVLKICRNGLVKLPERTKLTGSYLQKE